MNVLIHLLILFIFIFALLMMNIPQINDDEFIQQKLYIFVGIFLFEFIIGIISAIFKKCVVNISKIARSSLQSAFLAVIATAIYNDLDRLDNPFIVEYNGEHQRKLIISVMIMVFIGVGYFIDVLLTDASPQLNDCLNTLYKDNANKK